MGSRVFLDSLSPDFPTPSYLEPGRQRRDPPFIRVELEGASPLAVLRPGDPADRLGREYFGHDAGGLVPVVGACKRLLVAGGEGAPIVRGACRRSGGAVSQVALGGGLVGAVLLGEEDRAGDRGEDAHDDHDDQKLDEGESALVPLTLLLFQTASQPVEHLSAPPMVMPAIPPRRRTCLFRLQRLFRRSRRDL
jgi:hypothetical protein